MNGGLARSYLANMFNDEVKKRETSRCQRMYSQQAPSQSITCLSHANQGGDERMRCVNEKNYTAKTAKDRTEKLQKPDDAQGETVVRQKGAKNGRAVKGLYEMHARQRERRKERGFEASSSSSSSSKGVGRLGASTTTETRGGFRGFKLKESSSFEVTSAIACLIH